MSYLNFYFHHAVDDEETQCDEHYHDQEDKKSGDGGEEGTNEFRVDQIHHAGGAEGDHADNQARGAALGGERINFFSELHALANGFDDRIESLGHVTAGFP